MIAPEKNNRAISSLKLLAAIAGLLLFCACATTVDDLIRERYEGRSAVYPVSQDRAWEITRNILLEAGAKRAEIEETPAENVINWVSVLGIFIEPVDAEKTRVTAQRPPTPCNPLPPPLTEDMFLERFDAAMKQFQSGRPLPPPMPK